MRSLVAGGAGFIGSHLCEALLARGDEVICVDNLLTGREANIRTLIGSSSFLLLRHDLLEPLPELPGVDLVFHLASPASPPGYQRYQVETLRVNSEGTLRLLELAGATRARFLYASTSEVYGDPLEHPQGEDYRGNVSPTGPRSMYDEGKRYGEALCMAFVRTRQVDARIVRIFNTYGPRSDPDDGRMVPNFATRALLGQPVTVHGDGRQTRSLCYVSDLVEGLMAAVAKDSPPGQVFNLGNPDERTVLDYAQEVLRLTGSRSGLAFVDDPVGDDPKRRCPDISRAKELLGWEPKVTLEEGLRHTIDYFRAELGLASPETS